MTQLWSVREARDRRKPPMTQEELADKARIDQTYVSLIEAGKRTPSEGIKKRLAKALGIAPSRLRFAAPQPAATVDGDRDRTGHADGPTGRTAVAS